MASDFETVIAKCDGCKYEEECREMPPCILDAYNKGRADGYSQAENDYHKQTEKDRKSSYDCGYKQGRNDAIDEIIKHFEEHNFVVFDKFEIVDFLEWLKEQNNE